MKKNIFRVLASNGTVAIIGMISSLMLPGILSIDDYAVYQTFYLYLGYISVLSLGFPSGMTIKYAGYKRDTIDKGQYKSEVSLLLLVLLGFTLAGIVGYFVSKNMMLLCIALMILPYCYLGSYKELLQAWQEFRGYAVLHTILSALPLLLPIIVYFASKTVTATICILSYIATYSILCLICLIQHYKFVSHAPRKSLFSKENLNTEKVGIFFLLGIYINTLFHASDKQFVKWFCTTAEFSYYSFSITMQSVMTIFITAIALPLFPYMASKKLSENEYKRIKRILLMLGSMSGAAYFGCCLVVQIWLPAYRPSLEIIHIYFAVFPAMAIINCLYFNLYKIRKLTHRYVIDLALMFTLSIVGNLIGVKLGGHLGVAIATTVVYYVWLVYGTFVFKELRLDKRELLFISAFLLIFFAIQSINSSILGLTVYLVVDIVLCVICFPVEIRSIFKAVQKKVE